MKRVIGIIDLYESRKMLPPLTEERSLASVPFGGKYRLIDFMLSSMVNSGIEHVSVLLHQKYRSLLDHLGQGKAWGLDRKRNGLFILPPGADRLGTKVKCGNVQHFLQHRDSFLRSEQDFVLLASGNVVCNVDFRKMMRRHLDYGADVTLLYQQSDRQFGARIKELDLDMSGRVRSINEMSAAMDRQCISMEVLLMRKGLFLELIETADADGGSDFIKDAVMKNKDKLNIVGCRSDGVFGIVNTAASYYRHNMELLNVEFRQQLLNGQAGPVLTNVKDEPPTRYSGEGRISNALVANGCTIEGTVENSILFHGVRIEKGAVVRNSIVLPMCQILPYATIENVILDKKVSIGMGKMVRGERFAPFIAEKNRMI